MAQSIYRPVHFQVRGATADATRDEPELVAADVAAAFYSILSHS